MHNPSRLHSAGNICAVPPPLSGDWPAPGQGPRVWDSRRRTLHRARAKPHDHPYHSRVRIHVLHPFIRIIRASHARCHGHIEVVVPLPRDLLYQQRHLLVYIQKPPAPPVLDGRGIHSTCIDASHGIHQIREPLFFASLIDAEDGFILAGKSVAESIFQETAGSDDDWRISIMPDHFEKFFLYGFGKLPF